ncbi:MAG: RDD family protein [Rhodobacteraceae bacterium]|nr:RDD family protein [Paracoccaceae bacterium]
MEPRHFTRRLIATVIDIILLSQLVFYMMVPFADGNTVRLSGGIYQSVSCRIVPLVPESQAYFSERGVEAENGSLCKAYQNGFFAGSSLLVSSHTNAQGDIANDAITITVALDSAGQQVSPVFPVAYLQPILVLALLILITFVMQGQTLGKKITQVQVIKIDGDYPSFRQVAQREVLKFAPAIVLFFIGVFAPAYSLELVVPLLQKGENIALVLGFLGTATFIYILWWVAPMIWWNGTMPYDKFSNTLVERSY